MRSWEEDAPGNLDGAAAALTTFAGLPLRALRLARLKFWVRRVLGPPRPLTDLSFIHFARTALIEELADEHGERGRRRLIYFESHFNGGFDAYIDAFSYVAARHLGRIWRGACAFPGPTPATGFKRYIRERDYEAAHFHSAYPEATATDVSAALKLERELARLAPAALDGSPEDFADRWYRVLRERPRLERQGFNLSALWPGRDHNVARGGRPYGLTALFPVAAGGVGALRRSVERLALAGRSPFADVTGTHFARLVVLEAFPDARPGDVEPAPHLLLSTISDDHRDAYVRRLCESIPAVVDAVFERCAGAPPAADVPGFQRFVERHQEKTTTFFAPYAGATVADVRRALELRRRALDLAASTQHDTPRAVRAAFAREFVDPRTGRLR